MKQHQILACALVMMAALSSCSVVGGIFKAGVWTGIIAVVVIVLIIIWVIAKSAGNK